MANLDPPDCPHKSGLNFMDHAHILAVAGPKNTFHPSSQIRWVETTFWCPVVKSIPFKTNRGKYKHAHSSKWENLDACMRLPQSIHAHKSKEIGTHFERALTNLWGKFSGDFPLNHNEQKCKMLPNNNHDKGTTSYENVQLPPWCFRGGAPKNPSPSTRGSNFQI